MCIFINMKDRYNELNSIEKTVFYIGLIISLYGLFLLIGIGFFNIFHYLFLVVGLCVSLLMLYYKSFGKILKMIIKIIILILLIMFIIVEFNIVSFPYKKYEDNVDYVVLLGSGVSNNGLSLDFRKRIDCAFDYLISNNSMLVTTGGKGSNEPMAEGKAAYDYLIQKGIDANRIIIEDNSFSTQENLINAKKLIEENGGNVEKDKILIISSAFHLFRANYIAYRLGYKNVTCKGSEGVSYLWPYSYTREFFALIKELIYFNVFK